MRNGWMFNSSGTGCRSGNENCLVVLNMKKIILILSLILSIIGSASAASHFLILNQKITLGAAQFTPAEYSALRTNVSFAVKNMKAAPLTQEQVKLWFEIANKEVPKCQLKNVTDKNIISKINDCVAGI